MHARWLLIVIVPSFIVGMEAPEQTKLTVRLADKSKYFDLIKYKDLKTKLMNISTTIKNLVSDIEESGGVINEIPLDHVKEKPFMFIVNNRDVIIKIQQTQDPAEKAQEIKTLNSKIRRNIKTIEAFIELIDAATYLEIPILLEQALQLFVDTYAFSPEIMAKFDNAQDFVAYKKQLSTVRLAPDLITDIIKKKPSILAGPLVRHMNRTDKKEVALRDLNIQGITRAYALINEIIVLFDESNNNMFIVNMENGQFKEVEGKKYWVPAITQLPELGDYPFTGDMFSGDKKYLAAVPTFKQGISIFDVSTQTEIKFLPTQLKVKDVAWTPDNQHVIGLLENSIAIYEVATGKIIKTLDKIGNIPVINFQRLRQGSNLHYIFLRTAYITVVVNVTSWKTVAQLHPDERFCWLDQDRLVRILSSCHITNVTTDKNESIHLKNISNIGSLLCRSDNHFLITGLQENRPCIFRVNATTEAVVNKMQIDSMGKIVGGSKIPSSFVAHGGITVATTVFDVEHAKSFI